MIDRGRPGIAQPPGVGSSATGGGGGWTGGRCGPSTNGVSVEVCVECE